jgi:hypothetical protein
MKPGGPRKGPPHGAKPGDDRKGPPRDIKGRGKGGSRKGPTPNGMRKGDVPKNLPFRGRSRGGR